MTDDGDGDAFGKRLWRSIESHELAVKRAFETVGALEDELDRVATTAEDESTREALADLGRAIEEHEQRMEQVLDTLNRHKGVVREPDDLGSRELEQAMQEARRKAREESRPPRFTEGGEGDAGP